MPAKEKPTLDGLEDLWLATWEKNGTYKFGGDRPRAEVFSIDTPPPTVSGSLHVGHVFSYTHTDTLARYKRMRGYDVFYPMGWDDNGLPTERRVQNYFGVSCNPALEYDPNFVPPEKPDAQKPVPISRANFVELCLDLTQEDEQAFENLWRHLGLSVDWSHTYTTISEHSRRISQLAFLKNLERGEAYIAEAPCLWDTSFQTAVAQAELEDREIKGAYHKFAFTLADTKLPIETLAIETTRPELLPACVALVAHPDDARYKELFGKSAVSPLFKAQVPILAHPEADPEKGTGMAMVCTFGDTRDVTWWRELDLPVKPVMEKDGRLTSTAPPDIDPEPYSLLAGLTVPKARKKITELLAEAGELLEDPKPITHPVKFFEKGDFALEIITTRQWYLKNGGREEKLKKKLIKRGKEINWIPDYMFTRYENWVEGLNGDWLISRQRYFGVPIPLWYPLDENATPKYDSPIVPSTDTLPIDPSSMAPPGYEESTRGKPNGFIGDPDVMDTWATSSLTPFLVCGWEHQPELFDRTFPMDVRPQAHEIIRTWLFSSLVRSHLEMDVLPWKNATISGWVLDPDRKKMSKSKGNVITPIGLIEKYGADALRYWACSGRPGTDTAFEEEQIKTGRRLAVKILNAGKFVLNLSEDSLKEAAQTEGERLYEQLDPIDADMFSELLKLTDSCTQAFETFDYARSLELTESFFWNFTDNYIELVKTRAYGENTNEKAGADSANDTLLFCLTTLLKLFAPFLPFVTEEVWSWFSPQSIHTSNWPSMDLDALFKGEPSLKKQIEKAQRDFDGGLIDITSKALTQIRKYKSEAKLSLNAEIDTAEIQASPQNIELLQLAQNDLKSAGKITTLTLTPTPNLTDPADPTSKDHLQTHIPPTTPPPSQF